MDKTLYRYRSKTPRSLYKYTADGVFMVPRYIAEGYIPYLLYRQKMQAIDSLIAFPPL
jgi:hypothetical protein